MELRLEGAERPRGASCLGADSAEKQRSGKGRMEEHQSLALIQSHNVAGVCIWIGNQICTPVLCRRVSQRQAQMDLRL